LLANCSTLPRTADFLRSPLIQAWRLHAFANNIGVRVIFPDWGRPVKFTLLDGCFSVLCRPPEAGQYRWPFTPAASALSLPAQLGRRPGGSPRAARPSPGDRAARLLHRLPNRLGKVLQKYKVGYEGLFCLRKVGRTVRTLVNDTAPMRLGGIGRMSLQDSRVTRWALDL
jgi:hypothetical protein